MKKSVYIESSIPSYLTARPSRDVRAAAWQQLTNQWWEERRPQYDLFTSELVFTEIASGHPEAVARRIQSLEGIPRLVIDDEVEQLAAQLMEKEAIPANAEADALHIAVATVQRIDYFLTWNCRHIDNATMKPVIRRVCAALGYQCPEICTPIEMLGEDASDVSR